MKEREGPLVDDAGARSKDRSRAGSGPALRVRLTLSYDGTGFHGFAAQPGQRTVAGELAGCLQRLVGHPVSLTCAGRTDAGVHARGQVVHFEVRPANEDADLAGLARSLNRLLAPSIVVSAATVASPGFDARRSALARCYRYTVLNAPLPDPFLAATTWHVRDPLDVRAMQLATDPLLGEHDFSAFCRHRRGESLVRRVLDARWVVPGESLLRFDIEATSFCHQMVRSLVATLVEVGRGRRRAGDTGWILRSGERALAASPAPPHGLSLWEVRYATGA